MDGMNKEKWKALSPREKREHIREYYGKTIIVVLIIVFAAGWFLYEGLSQRDPQMSVIMLNIPDSYQGQAGFEGFLEEYDYEIYPGAVQMINHLRIFPGSEDPATIQQNYEHMQILHTMISFGDKELIFGAGQWYEETLVNSGALMDLSNVLPPSVLAACGDALIYSEATETEPSYPCAILLKNNAWLIQSGYYPKCYVGVPVNTDNLKIATDFLTYVIGQQ